MEGVRASAFLSDRTANFAETPFVDTLPIHLLREGKFVEAFTISVLTVGGGLVLAGAVALAVWLERIFGKYHAIGAASVFLIFAVAGGTKVVFKWEDMEAEIARVTTQLESVSEDLAAVRQVNASAQATADQLASLTVEMSALQSGIAEIRRSTAALPTETTFDMGYHQVATELSDLKGKLEDQRELWASTLPTFAFSEKYPALMGWQNDLVDVSAETEAQFQKCYQSIKIPDTKNSDDNTSSADKDWTAKYLTVERWKCWGQFYTSAAAEYKFPNIEQYDR